MRQEVTMPRMGQSMEEGQVLQWFKQVGDDVKRGEVIAEIETDKAAVEMESFYDGTLSEIVVPAGETVPIGAVIAIVEDKRPAPATDQGERQAPTPKARESRCDRVAATPVARRLADEHSIDLAQVEGSGPGGRIGREDVQRYIREQADRAQPETDSPRRIKASPAAKRLAQQRGVDLRRIEGTGPGGSISVDDVESWLAAGGAQPAPETEDVRRVALSKIKGTTAKRMAESKATVPHFYVTIDIDMRQALALRLSLDVRGQQVSVNDLVLRAAVLALLDHPHLNATFAPASGSESGGDEIHIHPNIDLAVAVALDEGLITPVVHNCDKLSLIELAAHVRELVDRARNGRLRADDLDVGTFTISNLGMFGVRQFEAIVNPPQAAILAVGQVRRVPAFDILDRIVAHQVMTATVSADHRVTDGAEVARFMRDLKAILEDGFSLLGE